MAEQEEYKCEYCGKCFSTLYNLSKHKKTANYCIEIQKRRFSIEPTIEEYICEYCIQSFTVKSNYQTHLTVCKVKKEREQTAEIEILKHDTHRLQGEVDRLSKECASYVSTINSQLIEINVYKKELELTQKMYEEKNEEIHKVREEVNYLREQLREKDEHIRTHPSVTNIYQTNNTNTKYEINFQEVFNKLVPFTEENVKQRVLNILPRHLIEYNDYNLTLNFCSNYARNLSDMVILTDKARGLVFIKNIDGEKEKHQIRGFIAKCLHMSKGECIQVLNSTRNLLEQFSLQNEIMPEDEARCYGDMTILREYIHSETMDKTVRTISNIVTNHCTYVTKLNHPVNEQKMIEVVN